MMRPIHSLPLALGACALLLGGPTSVPLLGQESTEDVRSTPRSDGLTPLHEAAESGDTARTRALIEAGAELDATTRIGAYTPLHLAAAAGRVETVRILLESGADPEARTGTGDARPLHLAAGAGSAAAVRALVEAGADVDARESARGQTPLIFAVSRNRVEAVRALIDAGADIEAATLVAEIPEMQLAAGRSARVRSELLDSMAEAAGLDPVVFRPTPAQVEFAVRRANEVAPAALLSPEDMPEYVDPDVGDGGGSGYGALVGHRGGLTPLLHAAREGHAESVAALLDAGADIDRVSRGDHTSPMLIATVNGHFDLALVMLERGADPDLASDAGATPLYAALNTHWAPKARYPQQQAYTQQRASYLDVARALLDAGADPNPRLTKHLWYMGYTFDQLDVDTRGSTPFWRAAYATDVEAMQLLAEFGADPTLGTVARAGRVRGDGELDPSGLPPVEAGDPAVLPIHAASGVGYGEGYAGNAHRHVEDGWIHSVRYLVEVHGADVNARDLNGYTPLHHAAARGDNELIMYLVSRGADPLVVSRRGQTTVDMANGPVQRISPFPETIALLESLGAQNNHNCRSC
ncbi:MAG TPA: ankyrin repeat domain-containing protein [Longimicrobiales bacterium]|nr:ankyrin repeat domain-containing protein [Longimicrobiales bacterium]